MIPCKPQSNKTILQQKTNNDSIHPEIVVPDNTPIPGLQMNLLESYSSFVIPHKNKHKISKSNKQNAIIIHYTKLRNM